MDRRRGFAEAENCNLLGKIYLEVHMALDPVYVGSKNEKPAKVKD
jgi:hypothetical protein